MWRPRTPVLELFPCSQNPAAVSLLAHWYGIAWLWSILFFFTNFTSAAALCGLWAPTVVPSFRVYLSWRCWSKTGLFVKLDMCSCCAQLLLNSPLFKVLLLMSSEQKLNNNKKNSAKAQNWEQSILCHLIQSSRWPVSAMQSWTSSFISIPAEQFLRTTSGWTSSWFQMWG